MKQTIRPPKGWRILKPGTVIKKGDKFYGYFEEAWMITSAQGTKVRPPEKRVFVLAYARKIKRKASQ
jgi:hypothetical protein